jgi:hypothetical protein
MWFVGKAFKFLRVSPKAEGVIQVIVLRCAPANGTHVHWDGVLLSVLLGHAQIIATVRNTYVVARGRKSPRWKCLVVINVGSHGVSHGRKMAYRT